MKHVKTIVVTGGACAGKTTGLIRIRELLAKRGWHPIVVPEAATLVFTGAGRPDFQDRNALLQYQKTMLKVQFSLEDHFRELATVPQSVILVDRGALDGKAFLTPEEWQAVLTDLRLSEVNIRDYRYDAVIHLVTTADGAPEAYKLEGVRNETPEQAIEQDRRLQLAYLGHGHHKIIGNRAGFEEKLHQLETEICNILGLPEPLEIERKFRLLRPPSQLPKNCVTSLIEQTYLTSTEDERRIRKRTQDGHATYTLGLKRFVSKGVRIEKEEMLRGSEYLSWLDKERDTSLETIYKKRHCFIHQGRCFELDEYLNQHAGLWILEVEVADMNATVTLPDWASDAVEVTGEEQFSNRQLAKRTV